VRRRATRPDLRAIDLALLASARHSRPSSRPRSSWRALGALKMSSVVKTTDRRSARLCSIVRGRNGGRAGRSRTCWRRSWRARHPAADYADSTGWAKRPRGRVLVDYNQNRWGSTLASIYSARPRPEATVSTPVTWKEVGEGRTHRGTSRYGNVPARVAKIGDVWKPLLGARGRFNLSLYV